MRFTKMHGAGNDYLYIDARTLNADWPALAQKMSDRHFGVGSDGIIILQKPTVDGAQARMRIFNADGSEAEMCGNGVRCFVKFAIERDIVPPSEQGVRVQTGAGPIVVYPQFKDKKVTGARVNMGQPRLRPIEVPVQVPGIDLNKTLIGQSLTVEGTTVSFTAVSMGNPHAVAFIQQPVAEFPLHTVGPKVEHHPYFPRRVNFEIVNIEGQGKLRARVWERGSGETLACGTGVCAIAVAARLQGLAGDRVEITMPGGTLNVEWDGQGVVWLEGPAVEVCEGDWPE